MVDPHGRQAFAETFVLYGKGFGTGALVGGGVYLGGTAGFNFLQGRPLTDGWTFHDLLITMAAGGLTAITVPGLTIFERLLVTSVIGFVATTWSMVASGSRSPGELIVGTAFGATGALEFGGAGAVGAGRAIIGSGFLQGLQNWLNEVIASLGAPPSQQLEPN